MGATKDKIPIEKNGFHIVMDTVKEGNDIKMLYFKVKIYAP